MNDDNTLKKKVIGGILVAIPILWALGALVTSIAMAFPNGFQWKPEYNREAHSHIENAYDANTPELMVKELESAKAGMHRLGLEAGDYCDMRPWKQVSSCDMKWQYEHIDSVIRRAQAVAADRDRQQSSGESDKYGDVFEEKMDNLRAFLKEDGWSDDLAFNAYYVEHHPFYAGFYDFFVVFLLAWVGTAIVTAGPGIALLVSAHDDGYY